MKPKWIIYVVIALLAILAVMTQIFDDQGNMRSFGADPITDSLVINTYPALYDAVFARDDGAIARYLNHESSAVRSQAWRALASTPFDSTGSYFSRASEENSQAAWMALSLHPLNEAFRDTLHRSWSADTTLRGGISTVLGRQGGKESLDLLLSHLDEASGSGYEYEFALALGRLMTRHSVPSEMHEWIFQQAFLSNNPRYIRAYLYGYYRGSSQNISAGQRKALYRYWKEYGMGRSAAVDQYIARLLKGIVLYELALYYNSEDLLDVNIQLATELAQQLDEVGLDDRTMLIARMLMMHDNPIVSQQAFQSLDAVINNDESPDHGDLISFIKGEMLADTTMSDVPWLAAMDMIADIDTQTVNDYHERLDAVGRKNPYLLTGVLDVLATARNPRAHLGAIAEILEEGDNLRSMQVISHLQVYWNGMESSQKQAYRGQVRDILFRALEMGDRGVAFTLSDMMGDSLLVESGDFPRIQSALSRFRLPEDLEVYQGMGRMLKNHFPEQAASLIDSLAALRNPGLNRSLRDAGWEVEVPDDIETNFRTPDWDRLWQMGRSPVWVLMTQKGRIRVEMNTLVAPATISAIDSLTRAGAYDGVPFHRVVPNFVIQGGDIERGDGYGGPSYVLPTEASEREYRRGAAGIASAGTDTEGSQYFFMHQWKPHLNGYYTRFGEIIEGVHVIDRIVVGDSVMQAYWE